MYLSNNIISSVYEVVLIPFIDLVSETFCDEIFAIIYCCYYKLLLLSYNLATAPAILSSIKSPVASVAFAVFSL